MVIATKHSLTRKQQHGMLIADLLVALGLLGLVLLPLSFSFLNEQKLARVYYYRALATEIVDGEMEKLAAGEWQAFPEGQQNYAIDGAAAKNLPAGKFTLTRSGLTLRLEWQPDKRDRGGKISREARAQ